MKTQIKNLLSNAIAAYQITHPLPKKTTICIEVERIKNPKLGDFASNIALSLAKCYQCQPFELAQKICTYIPSDILIVDVQAAPPGFINFKVSDTAFQGVIRSILQQKLNYGRLNLGKEQRIHMEFVSSNPTGPLHVGHGRHAAYGASLANILEMAGYSVYREYYVNDAGRQMQILAVSVWIRYLQMLGEAIEFPRRGYKGKYVQEIAKSLPLSLSILHPAAVILDQLPLDDAENEEYYIDSLIKRAETLLGKANFDSIFQHALATILHDMQTDLQAFGVTYQRWFHESELFQTGAIQSGIAQLAAGGFTYEKEGATWFKATHFGDEKDRVLIRENGQPTYFASDIAYHLNKFERGFDLILDIYGSDHHGYIPRLRALVDAIQQDNSRLTVLLVQFAILYRGKIKASMSTRGGDFVTLRELRQEVGNDAARFFYIMRKREQHLDFDLELAKSASAENPVYYIQYAHARICSVFRQLAQKNWLWDQTLGESMLSCLDLIHEKRLINCLFRYPEVIEAAAQHYEPALVASYLQELAKTFHSYYNATAFLVEATEIRNARLCLISAIRYVLVNGLTVLGLSAPEHM